MKTRPLHNILSHYSRSFLAALTVLAWGQTGCQPKADCSKSTLARVGQSVITEARYRAWWNERRPVQDTPEVRQAFLEKLIERSALAQAAREAALEQDPAVLEQMENLLIGRLRELQLQPQLAAMTISKEELRAAYEDNPKFMVPDRVRLAVLWYDTRGLAPLVARYTPRLQTARDQAAALPVSEGFGHLALANTEHRSSRFKRGDLGWLETGRSSDPWKRRVLRIAESLQQPGQLSDVVAADEGLFVVRLIERQSARVMPFAEVRAGIERHLLQQHRQEAEDQFQQRILAQAGVEQFPDRLGALQGLPVAKQPESSPVPPPLQLSAK